tara:strand:- start:429 stop:1280 length:852 start_codon:yes stop_codon:yes gene_type:complete
MANSHDYSIANDTGSAVRTDLNTLFTEVEATNAGPAAPSNLATGKLWYDTANNLLKQYNGSAWVVVQSGATPDIGTPSAGVVTNLSGVLPVGVTGGSGLDAVSPANLASGVLPVGVTGGSGLTALGTVSSGNISHADIVYPAGHIVKVSNRISGTRVVISTSDNIVLETISVNKTIAGSTLVIMGTVSASAAYAGHFQQGWKYGAGTEVLAQGNSYNTNMINISTNAVITGHTTTGAQNLVFRFYASSGVTSERPFNIYNPNSSDQANLGQTNSVFTIFEVLT